ncbi:MAG: glycosyl hydrolase family 18 protein [Eubacteriales bacterium]|nr:glycosyl hydrolase family 18 protein [Eubacteriales bacterium]MDD3881569.1 glycosyl hydrolase family 18 protein [Eubacteriales bacterium]MDD4513361.1 glycosyl hydrolase family 18 protein [Eubacteriales bacterium]
MSELNVTVKVLAFVALTIMLCAVVLPRHNGLRRSDSDALAAEKPLLITYIYDSAEIAAEDLSRLSQINFAFAGIKNGIADEAPARNIAAFSRRMKEYPKVRTVLSIGGFGMDGFSAMAATAEGRSKFAKSAVALMEKYSFRGIDIDWEYPGVSAGGIKSSKDDKENFTLLIKALRNELDAYNAANSSDCILTAAVGAGAEQTALVDWKAVSPMLDQVLIMTYDMSGFTLDVLHHTALYETENGLGGAQALLNYEAAGVPRSKLILGGAMYARCFEVAATVNAPGASGKTNGVKTQSYAAVAKLASEYPENLRYDENAQAPYFIHDGKFYTFDNERSVKAKAEYVLKNGFGGLMFWEYLQGRALIKTAFDAFE